MAETLRGFVLVVERRRIMLSTVFVRSVEEYLEDGRSALLGEATVSSRGLELADLGVDEDIE
jgi:hypothetical protein